MSWSAEPVASIERGSVLIQTQKPVWNRDTIVRIVLVAVLYFFTARIGQSFAMPPGNITPVWLPSGLMVALVLIWGYRISPGIFLGAFAGNIWAYFDASSATLIGKALVSASLNGIGDVLATAGAVYLFKRKVVSDNPLESLSAFKAFGIYCVISGSVVSAILGVTGLASMGFLPWSQYGMALLTWATGDAVGVLLIAPLVLSFYFRKDRVVPKQRRFELGLHVTLLALLSLAAVFHQHWPPPLPSPVFVMIPLLLWAVLRLGFRVTFVSVACMAAATVYVTSNNLGPFKEAEQLFALIELQLFLTLLVTSVALVGMVSAERDQLIDELKDLCEHDPLTGTCSRRYGMQLIVAEQERQARYGTPYSLIMFDIDHFKRINDSYGHATGDRVIQQITRLIDSALRDVDHLVRWGGEEFLVLLPNTTQQGALQFAERCRELVAANTFEHQERLSISLGVIDSSAANTVQDLLARVDRAMYHSKNHGRNAATAFTTLPSELMTP
ncbi:MASE1 domain-containing protein [Permianibacter aggregans]|uniref:diguanylate cyclase n=1 Tax=Permianibacter aggregans TaxID=1510150 RepID=A0A4V6PWL0_9GAMM|nr:diguanylate cyclase [Permianibacter aggregans]QGX39695.1 sensor domain-containing diguanylate cyclase [Permianibacter aggregans]TDQ43227.1 diguanylate cyclase (GGDEF)-like protein [Permianibacter aggregans]